MTHFENQTTTAHKCYEWSNIMCTICTLYMIKMAAKAKTWWNCFEIAQWNAVTVIALRSITKRKMSYQKHKQFHHLHNDSSYTQRDHWIKESWWIEWTNEDKQTTSQHTARWMTIKSTTATRHRDEKYRVFLFQFT